VRHRGRDSPGELFDKWDTGNNSRVRFERLGTHDL
jgi:hypothetical protein